MKLTEYEKTFAEQGVKDPPKPTDFEAGLVKFLKTSINLRQDSIFPSEYAFEEYWRFQ